MNKSNYQDVLKVLSVMCMIIDHTALYFLEPWPHLGDLAVSCRIIGRMAMPLFVFFAGYNFRIARSKILYVGLAVQLTTILVVSWKIPMNILIVIFLGQLYLTYMHTKCVSTARALMQAFALVALSPFTSIALEYGVGIWGIMILGYLARHNPKRYELCVFLAFCAQFIFCLMYMQDMQAIGPFIFDVLMFGALITLAKRPNAPIALNLRWLSRHLLAVYFLNIVIFNLALAILIHLKIFMINSS
ncbi:TraX family protein [Candidatus Sarmatiella mevalonica]|uniref:TraX family protein n=1 Tax=Candidatus Sarmatiella mevalonica TaxID=2770581 RepID=UPI001A919941|nr:TraX family protein [Candidatus Sarmatiella mevalonica]